MDTEPRSRMQQRGEARALRHIPGWAACNCLGLLVILTVPLWIGSFPERIGAAHWTAGAAATLQLVAAAATNILWTLFAPQYPRRWLVAAFMLVVGGGHQLAGSDSAGIAFAGLGLTGVFSGFLLAISNRQVVDTVAPHRYFAALTFIYGCFAVTFYMVEPPFQQKLGDWLLFDCMSGLAALGAVLVAFLPHRQPEARSAAPLSASGISMPALTGLVGFALLIMGFEVLNAYTAVLGKRVGLSFAQVGAVLSVASIVGLCGPVIAGLAPPRAGYARLIAAALFAMAVLTAVIGVFPNAALFAFCLVAIQLPLVFSVARIYGYLGLLDGSGRAAGMGHAALLIGASLGPVLGTLAGAPRDVDAVPLVAGAVLLLAAALFAVIGLQRRRPAAPTISGMASTLAADL